MLQSWQRSLHFFDNISLRIAITTEISFGMGKIRTWQTWTNWKVIWDISWFIIMSGDRSTVEISMNENSKCIFKFFMKKRTPEDRIIAIIWKKFIKETCGWRGISETGLTWIVVLLYHESLRTHDLLKLFIIRINALSITSGIL